MGLNKVGIAVAVAVSGATPALAQPSTIETLGNELREARSQIDAQRRALDAQDARIRALEARLESALIPPTVSSSAPTGLASGQPIEPVGVEQVGAPPEIEMPQVAVLGEQGNVITRKGQLTAEAQFEYSRSDRNRVLFRGIEIVEAVLIGIFDINESRQDVVTLAESLRYGVTDRFELGVRVPFVYRSDKSILAPIPGSDNNPQAVTVNTSADAAGLGDIELLARYQLTPARKDFPFLIGNLQVVVPTGTNPFAVDRDFLGRAVDAATGAGFWAVSPSVTAILPTDPAVLFGSIGYTRNFGRNVDTVIPPVRIEYVDPGDSVSASLGIGISLNQRTSFNLGYSHSWAFGTKTRTRLADPGPGDDLGTQTAFTRDLQLGRFLFGVTYRIDNRTSLNWTVEVGATDDASDVRTVLRVPFVLLTGK